MSKARGIILLNGAPYGGKIDVNDAFIVAADGGFNYAERHHIKVDAVIGDFDSLGYIPENAVVYPKEKDYTDGELVLHKMFEIGIKKVEIYCGSGLRDDHNFANLSLLYQFRDKFDECVFVTDYCNIYCLSGFGEFSVGCGKTISIMPCFGDLAIDCAEGLKYSVNGLKILFGSTRGVSNIAVTDKVKIKLKEGVALVFTNKNE